MLSQTRIIAVSLYISSMVMLVFQFLSIVTGLFFMDPIFTIISFLLFQEASKLLIMMDEKNGEDSSS